MSDFKLLAIRPIEGCHLKFSKLLKLNKVYQFYTDYKFKFESDNEDGEVVDIIHKSSFPDDFYTIRKGNGALLNINISAIVGKNGRGKSTMLELIYYSIYYLSTKIKKEDGKQ